MCHDEIKSLIYLSPFLLVETLAEELGTSSAGCLSLYSQTQEPTVLSNAGTKERCSQRDGPLFPVHLDSHPSELQALSWWDLSLTTTWDFQKTVSQD